MTHYKIKTAAGREFRVYSPNLDAVQRTDLMSGKVEVDDD